PRLILWRGPAPLPCSSLPSTSTCPLHLPNPVPLHLELRFDSSVLGLLQVDGIPLRYSALALFAFGLRALRWFFRPQSGSLSSKTRPSKHLITSSFTSACFISNSAFAHACCDCYRQCYPATSRPFLLRLARGRTSAIA